MLVSCVVQIFTSKVEQNSSSDQASKTKDKQLTKMAPKRINRPQADSLYNKAIVAARNPENLSLVFAAGVFAVCSIAFVIMR
jgi:hypothetical protein